MTLPLTLVAILVQSISLDVAGMNVSSQVPLQVLMTQIPQPGSVTHDRSRLCPITNDYFN